MIFLFKYFVYFVCGMGFFELFKKILKIFPLMIDKNVRIKFENFKKNPIEIQQAIFLLIKNNLSMELIRRQNIEKNQNLLRPYNCNMYEYSQIDLEKLQDYVKNMSIETLLNYTRNQSNLYSFIEYNLSYDEFVSLIFLVSFYSDEEYSILKFKIKDLNIFYVNRDELKNVKFYLLDKLPFYILNDPYLKVKIDSHEFQKFLEGNYERN